MNAITPITRSEPHRVGLRASDYLMLSDAGAFDSYGRTELIEGEVWAMNAIHSWHAATAMEIGTELTLALRRSESPLRVYAAGSILLSEHSVPEPDLSVGELNEDGVLPLEKVRLAIEISDTTASIDLGRKLDLYAQAGIAEYWVVERDTRTIHQFWEPSGGLYRERRIVAFGEPVTSATLPILSADTARI